MAQFRKKPVLIEAIQWTGSNHDEINVFIGLRDDPSLSLHAFGENEVHIKTLEGIMTANIGDWIIKGIKGEFYPCKPDIFAQTYDPV